MRAGPDRSPPPERTTSRCASTGTATSCVECTGERPPRPGALMVRREEQPWESRAHRPARRPRAGAQPARHSVRAASRGRSSATASVVPAPLPSRLRGPAGRRRARGAPPSSAVDDGRERRPDRHAARCPRRGRADRGPAASTPSRLRYVTAATGCSSSCSAPSPSTRPTSWHGPATAWAPRSQSPSTSPPGTPTRHAGWRPSLQRPGACCAPPAGRSCRWPATTHWPTSWSHVAFGGAVPVTEVPA